MQLPQGPAAEHWTAVVGRPSLVKSGALPPHPANTAPHSDAAAAERAKAAQCDRKKDVPCIERTPLA